MGATLPSATMGAHPWDAPRQGNSLGTSVERATISAVNCAKEMTRLNSTISL